MQELFGKKTLKHVQVSTCTNGMYANVVRGLYDINYKERIYVHFLKLLLLPLSKRKRFQNPRKRDKRRLTLKLTFSLVVELNIHCPHYYINAPIKTSSFYTCYFIFKLALFVLSNLLCIDYTVLIISFLFFSF